MLLWHGSRLSNFVGILSQGLHSHIFHSLGCKNCNPRQVCALLLQRRPSRATCSARVSTSLVSVEVIALLICVNVCACRHGVQVGQLLLHHPGQQHRPAAPLRGTLLCTCACSQVRTCLNEQVALGGMNELKQADYYADRLPAGKLSTKGEISVCVAGELMGSCSLIPCKVWARRLRIRAAR